MVGPRLPKGTRTRAERLPGEQPGATHNVLEGDRTAAGRLEYPTRWRHPYAEGCVRMAPKTLATLMRTRVRPFTACWHEARIKDAWSPSGSSVSPEHVARPTPVSPRERIAAALQEAKVL